MGVEKCAFEPHPWLAAGAVSLGIAAALIGAGAAQAEDTPGGSGPDSSGESSQSVSSGSGPADGNTVSTGSAGTGSGDEAAANDDNGKSDDGADGAGRSDDAAGQRSGAAEEGDANDPAGEDEADQALQTVADNTTVESAVVDGQGGTPGTDDAAPESTVEPAAMPLDSVAAESITSSEVTAVGTGGAGAASAQAYLSVAEAAPSSDPAPAAPGAAVDPITAFFLGLQRAYFNRTPTANPSRDPGQTSEGVVTGYVGAADPDGDPLTVELRSQAGRGIATVTADGRFTYTPSAALAATGGTDTFTVIVRETNAASHIHGLQGMMAAFIRTMTAGMVKLDDGSTWVQTVTVSIDKVAGVEVAVQQRGFAMPTWQVNGYDGPGLEQSLAEIKALGATWVEFTPTWYQDTRYSNVMTRTARTVSDEGLERAITLAHQFGLQVLLKPHIDLPNAATDSRTNIAPTDRTAWFSAYTAFITHYAEIAQRSGVEEFSVGTDLSSVIDDRTNWLAVIQAVRNRYDGIVLYAAGREWTQVPFWDALDMIGLDAYVPLSPTSTTDVTALQAAMEPYVHVMAELSARYGLPIVFTEAGFTSQTGTTTNPASWLISTVVNQAEQAAAYQALLSKFSTQPWWGGVFWWVWITPPDTQAEPLDFSPQGKAAEAVIRQWWT